MYGSGGDATCTGVRHVPSCDMCGLRGACSGVGGSVPAVFTLGAELLPAKSRGEKLTIISSAWMFGSIAVAFVAWLLLGRIDGQRILHTSWRVFAFVCGFPACLSAFMATKYMPESPR